MKQIIIIILLTFCVSNVFAQQYTPMTAAGYQMKRLKVDSTLHIPSFCGVPTTRNSTAKEGAIAIDTCNNLLYTWTNGDGWTSLSGGTIVDTAAINAAILLRVKYSDTLLMLQPYLRKIDTTNKWVNSVTKINDSTIRVVKNTITTDLKIIGRTDSTIYYTKYRSDTSRTNIYNAINNKLSKSDSTIFYTKYRSDTSRTNIYNAINLKLAKTDTTNKWVNNVTKKNDSTITVFKGTTATDILLPRGSSGSGTVTSVATGYGLSGGPITTTGTLIVDSATLSGKYLRKNDSATYYTKYRSDTSRTNIYNAISNKLSKSDSTLYYTIYRSDTSRTNIYNAINNKLNKTDTTNKFVNNVTSINDSTIRIFKGTTSSDLLIRGNASSGGVGTLQQVTDIGSTTTNNVVSKSGFEYNDETNHVVIAIGKNYDIQTKGYYPAIHIYDSVSTKYFDLWSDGSDLNLWSTAAAEFLSVNASQIGSYKNDGKGQLIMGDSVSFKKYYQNNGPVIDTINVVPIYRNDQSNVTYYYPATTSSNFKDTLATLRDVRSSGGGTAIDTTNRFVNSVTSVNDSTIRVFKGSTSSTITIKGGVKQNGRFGNDTATIVMVKIHNDAGVTLTNGKVVALTTSGNNNEAPAVRLANNKGDSTSANTLGFVTGTIANQDTGWVILSGLIQKLNTSAFSNGDIIYLDSTNGNITKTKPVAPYHMVYLGVVTKSNAGNGSIFVKAQNGYELDEIHDVLITSKLNNQVLAYSDTQKVWKNRNIYSIVDTTNTITTKYRTDTSRTNIYSAISGKIGVSDTSVFQRKNIAANSIQANNTASAANVTTQAFYDNGETAYTGTITWTGTTNPTSVINNMYQWSQIGKEVSVYIVLNYTNPSSAITSITLDLPSGLPTPYSWTGFTSALSILYTGNYTIFQTTTINPPVANRSGELFLRRNSANNGYELITSTMGVATARVFTFRFNYRAL